jgi:hypothetical protein
MKKAVINPAAKVTNTASTIRMNLWITYHPRPPLQDQRQAAT